MGLLKYFITCLLLLLVCSPTFAADVTVNLGSCEHTAINTAISNASASDVTTINVPAGECTWTGKVTIPATKTIKLIGAGLDSTIITSSVIAGANVDAAFILSSSNNSRISGFKFLSTATSGTKMILMMGTGWRIDHNYIDGGTSHSDIGMYCIVAVAQTASPYARPTGLVDANTITHGKTWVTGVSTGGTFNKDVYSWADASQIGTGNTVYFENNTITRGNNGSIITDLSYGGSAVYRYNDISGTRMFTHGLQSTGNAACRSWEVYNNKVTPLYNDFITLRAGTGMVYNNVIYGGATNTLSIYYERASTAYGTNPPASGKCDGTSNWDGTGGYPCRWQIGQGKDTSLWAYGDTPPAISAASEPAFMWNNTKSGGGNITVTGGGTQQQDGRDYFYGAAYADLSTKPTEYCRSATDCGYTCPHPLADPSAQGSCDYATAGTAGYTLTGGESDETAPTVSQAYVSTAGTSVTFTFDELITATSGAAFTLDFGTAVTLTCPAVSTAASSMTCTTSRTIYQAEGNSTFDYTGTKVADEASNALAAIPNQAITNLSTQVETPPAVALTISSHTGAVVTSSPSGISCGSTCAANFETGTTVTVSGYCLDNYSGFTITSGKDCNTETGAVAMSAAKECAVYCTKIAADNKVGTGTPGHKVGAGNPAHKRY